MSDLGRNLSERFGIPAPSDPLDGIVVASHSVVLATPAGASGASGISGGTDLAKASEPGYDLAHSTLAQLIADGQKVAKDAAIIANELKAPRSYEVAAGAIKTVAEIAVMLAGIENARAKAIAKANGPIHVENAIFAGSSEDLLNLIKPEKSTQKDE